MRTFLRSKVTLLFMTCAVLLAIPAIVLADNVQNDVVATAGQKIVSVQAGQTTGNVGYQIAETGGDSTDTTGTTGQKCNPAVTPAKLTLSGFPTGVTVKDTSNNTLTAPHLTFTTCGTYQYVKFAVGSSVAAGDYAISVSDITNNGFLSGDFNETPAAFTLRVTTAPPSDTTAPVIDYTLNPDTPDGSNGWYKSNVSLTWSVTDPESAVTKTGCVNQNITADQAETTYSCSATSAGGSAGPVNVSIKRDATPPTIDGSASPAPNSNGWNNEDVTVSYLCDDNLSEVASCGPDETLSSNGADQSSTGTAVDNAGNSATDTVSNIDIDKTPPNVQVTGVSNGANYITGAVPTAGCSTTDQAGLSGVKTNASVNVTGGNNGFGSFTATCTGAEDNADNTQAAPVSVQYTVSAAFNGFLQPIDGHAVNTGKYGRTYPIKWQLRDSNDALISDSAAQALVANMTGGQKAAACNNFTLEPEDALEESTTGSTALRYDATSDQFIYNYKAPSSGPQQCYIFAIRGVDGVAGVNAHTEQIDFKFTK